jgi:predicted 3-demethylubiquinone-9 3-methyltransferase (glyoxalase superfamily)
MQRVTPCLWFDRNGEEAVDFYVSVFRNAKKSAVTHYGHGMPMPDGTAMTVMFEIDGSEFMALNAGPHFKFTPAISLMHFCDTQAEIDRLWEKLVEGGGATNQCGWLTDRFGVSWQICPSILPKLSDNPRKLQKVMEAVMKMKKLDIAAMQRAYDQG